MATVINLYNQMGAGPKNISLNLINGLNTIKLEYATVVVVPNCDEYALLSSQNPQLHLIKLPRKELLISKVFFRLYLELLFIPHLMRKFNADSLLAFGNFLFTPGKYKKLVLCHHPYLYDNQLLSKATLGVRISEYLKRSAFLMTLWNVSDLVVQSNHVAQEVRKTWRLTSKHKIHVIPNPISQSFEIPAAQGIKSLIDERFSLSKKCVKILYVSRFYPHKNHYFLISLSKSLSQLSIRHEIQVTINADIPGASDFLNTVATEKLPINNLGELEQSKMGQIYRHAHFFVFPSHAETFGNPMIEAMCFALPLLLPALPYAKAIAGLAGNYFPADNPDACAESIQQLLNQKCNYEKRSLDCNEHFVQFPNARAWTVCYLETLEKIHAST